MVTVGETLANARNAKKLSLKKVATDLKIKEEILKAIESGQWQNVPETTFIKGFLTNYAKYLNLDENHILALYRREYDATKYEVAKSTLKKERKLFFTPTKFINAIFLIAVTIFAIYLCLLYFSVLQSPKLQVLTPNDDITTTVPVVQVTGKTEKDASVSISGDLVPVDQDGNFSYEVKLKDGKNMIEIIASKKLSPKSKVTKTIRLVS